MVGRASVNHIGLFCALLAACFGFCRRFVFLVDIFTPFLLNDEY